MQPTVSVTRPQALPSDWSERLGDAVIPTERDLSPYGATTDVNTRALAFAVTHAFGKSATPPPRLEAYSSGTFNRIFRATLSEGGETFDVAIRIARKLGRFVGRIETTVALMTFSRYHLGLPVPRIYAWCDGVDSDGNPVNVPYIMMEFLRIPHLWYNLWHYQTPSRDYWDRMMDVTTKGHALLAKPVPWSTYGSVYFTDGVTGSDEGRESDDILRQLDTYRLGPFMPGTMATASKRVPVRPGPEVEWRGKESLVEFWTILWRQEVDAVTQLHEGDDPSTTLLHLYDSDSESDDSDNSEDGSGAGSDGSDKVKLQEEDFEKECVDVKLGEDMQGSEEKEGLEAEEEEGKGRDSDFPVTEESKATVAEFHQVANEVLKYIRHCPLPDDPSLYQPCIVPMDFAMRNLMFHPETEEIVAYVDWDDTAILPFILCSKYIDELCSDPGTRKWVRETGGFPFLPPVTYGNEGEFEEIVKHRLNHGDGEGQSGRALTDSDGSTTNRGGAPSGEGSPM
ncbi:hypothetical protein CC2G_012403 [Coprinopsis cinerea AmutBmut pab1-1]|nr:hypothetical protein CC2G_012403 [Coprinopsis cinerea AmutBmut pab1-1]